MSARPAATLSLDLDDLWSYQRTRGDPRWADAPSLLPRAVPRIVEMLGGAAPATLFVVGRDAANPAHGEAFGALAARGFEIANHSHEHRSDFHRCSSAEVEADLGAAEAAIEAVTGERPRGFRGPSFRLSAAILGSLARRGYVYDASTLPTVAGPLARAWYFAAAGVDRTGREAQRDLFGSFADGRRPLRPYRWALAGGTLVEIPVTTLPLLRVPVHFTYVNFLADVSETLAAAYFRATLALCRARRVPPSLLLHAADFIGADDPVCPAFLPGMRRRAADKLRLLERLLEGFASRFEVCTLGQFAASAGAALPAVEPRFD